MTARKCVERVLAYQRSKLTMQLSLFDPYYEKYRLRDDPEPSPAESGRPPLVLVQGPQPQPPRAAGNGQLSQLLLSSAWCSFHYSQTTGSSSSTRYQFYRDGSWSTGGRTETYNSGANGTVAGQYDSSNRGRWEVRGGQLLMSTPQSPALQSVAGFSVTRNSSGYPIINADGREFSSCNEI